MVVLPDPQLNSPANRILLVLGQTPFPVELLDQQFRVIYCNLAYTKTFLPPASVALDRPTQVFPEVLPDGRPRCEVLAQVEGEGLWKGELTVNTANGEPLPVRVSVFPIHQPGDQQFEYSVFYEDISEEVSGRQELAHQRNLFEIRSRQAQTGELLSMIAHQWRQPLTVVMSLIGNIQLKAQMGPLDAEYLNSKLEKMSQSVHFLSETIDSFRNFYAPSKFKSLENLSTLVRRALDLVLPSLVKLGIQLEIKLASNSPMVRVFAGEIMQVALELINNARDALTAGAPATPLLRLTLEKEAGGAVLRVENNGGNIPVDDLPHIYDPYYTIKDGPHGAGLGLYMAKLIVENHHGGALSVVSSGGLTTFTCILPMEDH